MGIFAYYDQETEGVVYHVVPSPESEYPPSSIGSETDSTSSWSTVISGDLPGYFVLQHGRPQAASDNALRWFPVDSIQRQVMWYFTARAIFGGDYMGPVEDVLAPVDGRGRYALEIGTRAGTWIQAMATQFPHVQFRTLDMVPMVPHVPRQNVIFEVYDFAQGLKLEDQSQDAVFLNLVLEMVKNFGIVLREVHRVLRPGGLIHIQDHNGRLWDPEDPSKLAQLQPGSQIYRLSKILEQKAASLGIDLDTCEKVPQWLEPGSELWDNDQKGFKEIELVIRACPFYPHESLSCASRIDAGILPYVRRLGEISLLDTCGHLRDCGLEDKEAENLVKGALGELRQHENCVSSKSYCVYAIKL